MYRSYKIGTALSNGFAPELLNCIFDRFDVKSLRNWNRARPRYGCSLLLGALKRFPKENKLFRTWC